MSQFYITQVDNAFYNDGTESGSTLISGGNITVGNTGSPNKPFDTPILIRSVLRETGGKSGSGTFQLRVSKNSGEYLILNSVAGITAVDSANLTPGDDTTQRLGSGTFVSNNNLVGDNTITGSCSFASGSEAESLFTFEIDEADVSNGDTFDLRVYFSDGTALNVYTETLRVTVQKGLTPITGTLTKTLANLSRTLDGDVLVDGSLAKTLADLTLSGAGDVEIQGIFNKALAAVTLSATGTVPAASLYPFVADHEEGDLTDWDSDNGGGVSATVAAAMNSTSYGLQVDVASGDTSLDYVSGTTGAPSADKLRFGFYFDPNTFNHVDGGEVSQIFHVSTTGGGQSNAYNIMFRRGAGSYQVAIWARQDTSVYLYSGYVTISDGPHTLEFNCVRESSDGADDGTVQWWIDGTEQTSYAISSIENYNAFNGIDEVECGISYRNLASFNGTLYFDEVTVNDTGNQIFGGLTPIAGTLTKTLSTITISADGDLLIDGDLSKTLATIAISADGDVLVEGNLAKTLAELIASGSGEVDIAGVLTKTLEALTSSAAGEVDITGILDETLAALLLSATGVVGSSPITGSLIKTLAALSASADGDVLIEGLLNKTLAALVLAAAGQAEIEGILLESLGALVAASTGTVEIAGTLSKALGALTSSGAGTVFITGDLSKTLAALTSFGEGWIGDAPVVGSLSKTLGALTLASTGDVLIAGTFNQVLGALLLAGLADVDISGSLSSSLGVLSLSSAGDVLVQGILTQQLASISLTASGRVEIDGVLISTFEDVVLSATGTVLSEILGILNTQLGALVLTASGRGAGFGTVTITAVKLAGVELTASLLEDMTISVQQVGDVTITKGLP